MAYGVERDKVSDNPDDNLEEKMAKHLNSDIELAIIQCGSNDVTRFHKETDDTKLLADKVKKNSVKLVDLAQAAADNFSCKVFISETVPRYDNQSQIMRKMVDLGNAVLKSETAISENVFVIEQGRLACSGKVRAERYAEDGIHLTDKVVRLLTTNMVAKTSKICPYLVLVPEKEQRDGNPWWTPSTFHETTMAS